MFIPVSDLLKQLGEVVVFSYWCGRKTTGVLQLEMEELVSCYEEKKRPWFWDNGRNGTRLTSPSCLIIHTVILLIHTHQTHNPFQRTRYHNDKCRYLQHHNTFLCHCRYVPNTLIHLKRICAGFS